MDNCMKYGATLTGEADRTSAEHLLQHYRSGQFQEDLCFALWRPSSGSRRYTALIDQIVLPNDGDRNIHGNASFEPDYMARAITYARQQKAGLAFMHSHPGPGWQNMSSQDVTAERDVLAYPAGATGLPLLGLTIGTDGYWSARFWRRDGGEMTCHWCDKVRILDRDAYKLYYNDLIAPPPPRRNILKRTFDTWGERTQHNISRMNVGIVGVGSVGSFVAESMARIGVTEITLIDPDRLEEHNLDRLLYGTVQDIGRFKVDIAAEAVRKDATAPDVDVLALPLSIRDHAAYSAALDCDILFSCVDRPLPRDVLNYIAHSHLIPVIDGGIAIELNRQRDAFFSAHWRAHIITPYHECLRCNGQYDSSMVVMELDGSLDDPSYVRNLPPESIPLNLNVFPFSQSVASMEVNLMLRYLLAPNWWPTVGQQDYQFMTGETLITNAECHPYCSFRQRRAQGDIHVPPYLTATAVSSPPSPTSKFMARLVRIFGRVFARH